MSGMFRDGKSSGLAFLLLLLLTLLLYHRIFQIPPDNEFIYYIEYPIATEGFGSFVHWLAVEGVESTRFLRQVSFFFQGLAVYATDDYFPALRLLQLLLFALDGWLIFLLLRRENAGFGLAGLGAVLFLVHPIHAINMAKLLHLAAPMFLLFFLAALNVYSAWRDRPRKGPGIYALEGVCLLLLLFTYELAVVAPVLLVLYEGFIKAGGSWSKVKFSRLGPSLALWGGLTVLYLLLRLVIFNGLGGYDTFGQVSLIRPFAQGAKWLSGVGFLHLEGQAPGWLDLAVVTAQLFIFTLLLRRPNRLLLGFAFAWFSASILPFFFLPATYHYIYALPLVGLAFTLALCLKELPSAFLRPGFRLLPVPALAFTLLLWAAETRPGVRVIEEQLRQDLSAAGELHRRLEPHHGAVTVFLATEREDPHLLLRLARLRHPQAVEVRNLPLSGRTLDSAGLAAEDQTRAGGKIYAWRQTGETFSFYPSLEALLKAMENPATARAAGTFRQAAAASGRLASPPQARTRP
ncbi:MAG: hypothetical protein C4524_10460 [Candidatus Zixiibacteriota bacterium]|nr:MAG: hypothetical protein C4524_10460 [candidate division Zixibacteria bacterium]